VCACVCRDIKVCTKARELITGALITPPLPPHPRFRIHQGLLGVVLVVYSYHLCHTLLFFTSAKVLVLVCFVCVWGGWGWGGVGGGVLALSLASRIFWTHACFAYIIILLYKYPPPHYLITGLEDLLASHSLFSGFCDGLYNMCGFGCVYVCASYVYTLHLCLVCVCVCGPPHMTHVSSSSYDASSRGILELDHSVTRTHTFTCAYTCRRRER
jgi:hypothetical protein